MQTIKIYKPGLLINAPFGVKTSEFAAIWHKNKQVSCYLAGMYR
jgi:hypothetical protein